MGGGAYLEAHRGGPWRAAVRGGVDVCDVLDVLDVLGVLYVHDVHDLLRIRTAVAAATRS